VRVRTDPARDLPYEANPGAKDDLLALFKKKWGEPKPGRELGNDVLVFHASAPRVTIKDNTIVHAWNVRLSNEK
jgi:hypothetical protein